MHKILGLFGALLIGFLLSPRVKAQSIFEEAVHSQEESAADQNKSNINLTAGGYLRSGLYLGKNPSTKKAQSKSLYAEASLQVKSAHSDYGRSYVDLRFSNQMESELQSQTYQIKEAYVATYLGPLDLKLGQQIIVWGRADGINPSDNISPKNLKINSPHIDDKRLSNFIIDVNYAVGLLEIEALWVPVFKASTLPLDQTSLFGGAVSFEESDFPSSSLKDSARAVKIDLKSSLIDGSFSYYYGPSVMLGLDLGAVDETQAANVYSILLKPYFWQVWAGDFSTTVKEKWGLRGEIAYKKAKDDYKTKAFVPYPYWHYVLGLDRDLSTTTNLMLQYIGTYVQGFSELEKPSSEKMEFAYQIKKLNRLISETAKKTSHSIFARIQTKFLYETLRLELAGSYQLVTEEHMIKTQMTYDIYDALACIVGWQFFDGPQESLYQKLGQEKNLGYFELKSSF